MANPSLDNALRHSEQLIGFLVSTKLAPTISARSVPLHALITNEQMLFLLATSSRRKVIVSATGVSRQMSVKSAEKLYDIIASSENGPRWRRAEKVVTLCRHAWKVVHARFPREFRRDIPNPWESVTLQPRQKAKKPAVTRQQVYQFARGCIEHNQPGAAAAAVICFEFLQRPENVLAGHITWSDYRNGEWPNAMRIFHHKTKQVVWHPLEDEHGTRLYAEAEDIFSRLPRRRYSNNSPSSFGKALRNPIHLAGCRKSCIRCATNLVCRRLLRLMRVVMEG